ncbi:TPM domain-containing protein [Bacteriovorax sp. PP10]|uniref:TPM domain-containing protein n=1 Tax=Bacteriovorax antarcticus TaxID=3088717 RepID=A0ABU5VYV5_9BACT|nr:TPM domain-containing protein [Bacteriovorax sp. PP10]MEA9358236.1 TPM domain-containing protein [Bacteriovorax sp. PP10]
MNISIKDRELIKELITEAEQKSDSEMVPMIVSRSDNYPAAHFRAAIIVSFLFSLGLYFSPLSIINPIYFLWIQLPGLILGYYLANIPSITRLLITKQEVEYEVTQRAIEAFFEHNLHTTEQHNGVLIFISILEKKIKIITDVGVRKKVDQKIWDEIIYSFTEKVKEGEFVEALKSTIAATSTVLENYFPATGKPKKNELKNDIIIE